MSAEVARLRRLARGLRAAYGRRLALMRDGVRDTSTDRSAAARLLEDARAIEAGADALEAQTARATEAA